MVRLGELATVALLNLAALGVIVWQLRDPRAGAIRVVPPASPSPGPTATAVLIHVHVTGAVREPGVVVLAEGARADDAVRAAGGASDDADMRGVNLAAPLADGCQLHVPVEGETPVPAVAEAPAPAVAAGLAPPVAAGPVARVAGPGGAGPPSQIDLNRASAVELEALPGIGPALAERIVAFRTERGPFATVDDILAVPGIGERTLERFRAMVTVR